MVSRGLSGLGSLPRPQEPAIRLVPFLNFTPSLFKIIFNIIYPQWWLSRYSDWLRAGRSGDQIPVGGEIFRTCPDRPWGPT